MAKYVFYKSKKFWIITVIVAVVIGLIVTLSLTLGGDDTINSDVDITGNEVSTEPKSIVTKAKEAVGSVVKKVVGGTGSDICGCYDKINFTTLKLSKNADPMHVAKAFVEANPTITISDVLRMNECALAQIKNADKSLDALKNTNKPAYIQKVLISLINNKCVLNLINAVDMDDFSHVVDMGILMLTHNLTEVNMDVQRRQMGDFTVKEVFTDMLERHVIAEKRRREYERELQYERELPSRELQYERELPSRELQYERELPRKVQDPYSDRPY